MKFNCFPLLINCLIVLIPFVSVVSIHHYYKHVQYKKQLILSADNSFVANFPISVNEENEFVVNGDSCELILKKQKKQFGSKGLDALSQLLQSKKNNNKVKLDKDNIPVYVCFLKTRKLILQNKDSLSELEKSQLNDIKQTIDALMALFIKFKNEE